MCLVFHSVYPCDSCAARIVADVGLDSSNRMAKRGGAEGAVSSGDPLDEEQQHLYIAAMQLFPIKLNFSFIKNADVKV